MATEPAEPRLVGDPLQVGDLRVTPVSDGVIRFRPTEFFPTTGDADWAPEAHGRWLDGGDLALPLGCFVVETSGATVLVDCGLKFDDGGDWRGGRLPDALAAAGFAPADVDVVLLTHLHLDHVGWVGTFDNATYRCHQADWDWARDTNDDLFRRRLVPVEDRLEPVEDGQSVAPGVTVRAAPGHTPGHVVVVLSDGDERAFLLGDAIHCPAQLTESDWYAFGDVDPEGARRTREALMRELDGEALVGPAHFPNLSFGRLVTGGEGRTWVPLS